MEQSVPERELPQFGRVRLLALLLGRLAFGLATGLLVLGWIAADSYGGARVVDLRHLLGLALIAMSPVLALGRSWRSAAASLGLGLCACASGWWLGFAARPEAQGGPELRVGSANLLFGIAHPTPLGEWIEARNLDVLALQEVLDSDRSKLNWPRILESWRERFPYQWVEQHEHFGLALLSRIPFERVRMGSLSLPDGRERGRPLYLEARLEWGAGTRVVVMHPVRPGDAWRKQERERFFEELGRELGAQEGRLLVMGDCNATGASPLWQSFLQQARLVDSRVGFGRFPTWAPRLIPKHLDGGLARDWLPQLLALDHLLVRGLVTVDRGVGPRIRSDHSPIHAVLQTAAGRHSTPSD